MSLFLGFQVKTAAFFIRVKVSSQFTSHRLHINGFFPTDLSFDSFQHYLTMFGSTVALPLLIAKFLCVPSNGIAKSQLICTIFFVSGLATLLQSTVGVRYVFKELINDH
jgi:xanthine/uracil permease